PHGSLDTTCATNGKLVTGIGKGTRHSSLVVILDDGRIHVTGFRADGSEAAWEYDANGNNGFDRMAAFVGTVRPASVTTALPTGIGATPQPGTLAYYARTPFVGPMLPESQALALSSVPTTNEGDTYNF